jgi:aromatic-L-amino-acid/L-tryptophan decarboxylase
VTDRRTDPPAGDTSLDPRDWDEFRRVAHAALDDAIEFVRTARERPVWRPMPEAAREELAAGPPARGEGLEAAYDDLRRLVLPYALDNVHPRFWGWVHGAGVPIGIVTEMMSAAMNLNCGGRDHVGIHVERAVVAWCRELFRLPAEATGVILTGTSMANLTGLAVARNAKGHGDVRKRGVQVEPKPLVAYASAEVHDSVGKALEVLGLGREGLRLVPVDEDFRMTLPELRRMIRSDRESGAEPFCVVGTAGTVNTGAIDDLEGLAAICREEGLWLHVDGAFGALVMLSDELRPRIAGIERGDSIAFDFHKWMHAPYDAGCLLVRDGDAHRRAFGVQAAYLRRARRGLAGGGDWPCDFGPELSKGFRALKVWLAWKEAGSDAFARSIESNVALAEYLDERLRREPGVEVANRPSLSVVCFRFRRDGWDDAALDALNEDVAADLQESGVAVPSTTRLRGRSVIRVNVTNHRTRREDLDLFVRAAREAAEARFAGSVSPPAGAR